MKKNEAKTEVKENVKAEAKKTQAEEMKQLNAKVEGCILEMTNEQMMMFRFANLSDAEVAYLKKMLANYNN